MLPFLNVRLYRNNFMALQPYIEKMKSGQLTLENILEEDDIIQDLKTNQNSQFLGMISSEAIRKLIDYATKLPASDDKNVGHKYPFNATELLCCDNNSIMERIMNEIKLGDDDSDEEEEKEDEEKEVENEGDKKEENEEQNDENKNEKQEQQGEAEPQEAPKQEVQEEPKPEGEEEPKPEAKEEPKPEAKEEPKPEAKEEPKPEAKEEPKPEVKEEQKQEVKEEPKTEVKEEPKPEVKEEPKPEVKEEPKPEAKEEQKQEVKEEPKPEAQEAPKEEVKEEQKVEAEPKKEESKQEGEEENKAEEKKEEEKKEEENKPNEENKKEDEDNEEEQKEDQNKEEENENEDENSKKEGEDSEKDEEPKPKCIIYDNIDYLLEFLKQPEETKSNYVLVGYFYKILNHLFSSQTSKIVMYLYDYPKKKEFDVLELLVKNMNRKSMGEIINKLILFQEETEETFAQKRMELFKRVLEELREAKEQDKYECICSTLESTIYNKTFLTDFMKDPQYYIMLYTILGECKDIPKKLIAVMKLIIKINESILKNVDGRATPSLFQENPMDIINMFSSSYQVEEDNNKDPNVDMNKYIADLYTALFNSLEQNKFSFIDDISDFSKDENKEFTSTYQKGQKRIGMKKLTQVELFRSILDMLVNGYIKYDFKQQVQNMINIAEEKDLFWKITQIFLDYPFSSLFQTIYNQIMNIVFINEAPDFLIKSVLISKKDKEEKNLVNIFMDKVIKEMTFSFNSERKSFNPNFSFEVTILSKIYFSENPTVQELIKENNNLKVFDEVIGEEIKKLYDQKLLLSENDIQFSSQSDKEEKKPEGYFKKKNFMESIEEDISIYNMFLKGENYQAAFNEKKEREKKEKEEKEEKELEEEKKKNEDDQLFAQEGDANEEKNVNLKGSINIGQEENNEEEENNGENNEDNNEKKGEKEGENEEEESSKEETEEEKKFNDVNFWKMESYPDDSIMSSILNDLD